MSKERLTTKSKNGKYTLADCTVSLRQVIEKLAEYEDLKEQNLLLRLPVAVGDTVWRISTKPHNRSRFVEKTTVSRVAVDTEGMWVFCKCNPISKCVFGKTAFLTQAEAEKKLKELEGK